MFLALSATSLFGGSMAWGVHVRMLLQRLYGLVRILFWLVDMHVRYHLCSRVF